MYGLDIEPKTVSSRALIQLYHMWFSVRITHDSSLILNSTAFAGLTARGSNKVLYSDIYLNEINCEERLEFRFNQCVVFKKKTTDFRPCSIPQTEKETSITSDIGS